MDHNLSSTQPSSPQTHLFTVRLWRVPVRKNQLELRGKVQHVLSGEVEYFQDWKTLETFMDAQMEETADGSAE